MLIERIEVKSILNKHKKRDEWFLDDYSVNPYIGCSFGCIYCYVRGSKYGKDSRKVNAKMNSPHLLEKQLRRKAVKGEYGIIAVGTSTEPYMDVEKELRLTRRLLEIIAKYRFPVHILTKSTLVLRDCDLINEIDEKAILPDDIAERLGRGAMVSISMSVIDESLSKLVEPKAPPPEERMTAITELTESDVFAGVAFIPVLPFISDSSDAIDKMIKLAKESKAEYCFVGALTLFGNRPSDCRQAYFRFIEKHYPHLLPDYEKLFRHRFQPPKEYQQKLDITAREICKKYGVRYRIL